nr:RNA-binding S4 domain-containing protein [uncultured Dethiosulfovibrio sp.]
MTIRVDKYLKLSRLVKRRTVAQEMVDVGAVRISGRKVKPSADVKVGDILEVAFPRRLLKVEILVDDESALKRKGVEPYRMLLDEKLSPEDKVWG